MWFLYLITYNEGNLNNINAKSDGPTVIFLGPFFALGDDRQDNVTTNMNPFDQMFGREVS